MEASLLKNTDAMFELLWCYWSGQGVEKDFEEAIKWLKKAAERNHPAACCEYGWCLKHGIGVEKDPKKAMDYFDAGAKRGCAPACYEI